MRRTRAKIHRARLPSRKIRGNHIAVRLYRPGLLIDRDTSSRRPARCIGNDRRSIESDRIGGADNPRTLRARAAVRLLESDVAGLIEGVPLAALAERSNKLCG